MSDYNDMSTTELTERMRNVSSKITENNAVGKELTAEKSSISKILIDRMEQAETNALENEFGTFTLKITERAHVKDWDSVYKYIRENDAFYLLNKAMNVRALKDALKSGEVVPETEIFEQKSVGVTKPKAKYSK